ncbi:MAG: tetratricopeptide repeat protein [Verrucomicrobiales bacterium]|nr:tetratricopeptide repeat protein [Verrucomicrobiales bacterium]
MSLLAISFAVAQDPAPPAAPGASPLNLQEEVEALYEAAFGLFQEAKYQEALSKLVQIREKMNRPPERVLFVEGACYFNLNEYEKAITTLRDYLSQYPDGENAFQVKLALGRSLLSTGKADEGVKELNDVASNSPELKGQAGLFLADHYRKTDKTDDALKILRSVVQADLRSPEGLQAAMMAADILVAKGDLDEASKLMESVRSLTTGGDNVAQMNNVSLKLGDQMLDQKRFAEALAAYQMVRRQSEITRIVKERVEKLEASIASQGKGPVRGTPEELDALLKTEKGLLEEIEQRPDYDASLYYRLGRCYFEMARYWESLLAFQTIVKDYPSFAQRDRSMYGMIIANAQLRRVAEARKLCEEYIADFPDSSNLGEVSELYGMLAYNAGDLEGAERSFDKALGFPKADKERLLFLRASVLFEMQRFEDARVCLELLLSDNPESAYKDDAQYRIALSYFYQNDFKNVTKALRNYLEDNPRGQFVVDAKYRLAFIKFQGREVEEAMEELEALTQEAPNDPNIGQVYALLGDAYNQQSKYDDALNAFANAVDKAKTPDVLDYAMDNATDLYVGQGKWAELADMWQSYYTSHKDNETQALKAIFWISRAKVREGKIDEAKTLLADAIKPMMANAANEQVEVLVQQLADLMAPKRRRSSDGNYEGPTFEEVSAELEKLITPPQEGMNGTAQMRILFAKAWLAQKMRETEKAQRLFDVLVEVANPDDLSPLLLSVVGDNARSKGNLEKAEGCYNRLIEYFSDSEFADAAPVGLAEIAYSKEEYDKALELFDDAVEKYAASSRLLDATLGRAKTLVKLNKLDEADELYTTIANTREWRGEPTATALYMLGEIAFMRKDYARAIPYFQRVFVAHQRWKSWVAKAYLQCARCFLQLNRPADPTAEPPRPNSDREAAKLFLIEMTARKDLQDEPEMQEAKTELSKL